MSRKANVKLSQLSKLHNKNTPESKILSSTSRKFISETGREIKGINSDVSNQGNQIEMLALGESKKYVFKLKILKDQQEIEVNYEEGIILTVKNFKNIYLKNWLMDGQNGARLIYNGRELKDSSKMEDFKDDFQTDFDNDNKPMFHIFLFLIADRI